MSQSRRSLLKTILRGGAAVTVVGAAGCLSPSSDDTTDDPEPGTLSIPNPIIEESRTPSVSIVSTTRQEQDGSSDAYVAELENTAVSGSVAVNLYWVSDEASDEGTPSEDELQQYGSKRVTIEQDDLQTVSFTGSPPEGYTGFWFRVSPVTVVVDVVNNGGDGTAVISLRSNGDITDETTISIKSGEEKVIELTSEVALIGEEFNISARPREE